MDIPGSITASSFITADIPLDKTEIQFAREIQMSEIDVVCKNYPVLALLTTWIAGTLPSPEEAALCIATSWNSPSRKYHT